MIIDSGLVTGSLQVTGNTIISGSIEVTQGITGSFKGNAETATSASFASTATTASYALTASYLEGYVSPFPFTGDAEITGSLTVTDSISSTQGFIGSLQGNADTATSASYAAQSSNATSASFAQTASNVDTLYQDVELHGNLTVYGTSSFNYVTSSQLDVQQSFISVNVFEPAERFGGIKVYDSGSSDATASLAWDSLHNHWIYQNVSGSTYSGGMLMSGPRNTGSLGDEPNLARWMVARSDGGDHLENTQIYSSGSTTQVTGSLLVTQGVTASLSGTASNAVSASTALYALTASYLEGYVSPFPFTGSATITGSLEVDGPTTATSFIKEGGTSSEYLMADGSTTEGGTGGASIRVEENFVATAGQTVFPITYEIGQIDVYYNGLKLYPDEFTATNGTSVVLQEAAVLNSQVSIVKYVSATTSTAVRNEVVFVATANQNTFSVNYTVGQVDVFHNGVKLNPEEFTATNGTSVVLGFDCLEGASVTMLVYLSEVSGASGTANYVTKFTGTATMEDSQIYDNGTNIGIAKASPNAKLDVNGNTIITGSLNVTQGITGSLQGTATTASFTNVAGLGGFVQGGNSFGSQATLGTNDNQSLALETSGSTRMFISSSGNVGIGTTTPKAKTEFSSGLPTSIPTYTNKTNGIVITDGGAIYGRLGVSNFSSTGAGYPTYLQAGDFDGALYYNLLLNPLGGNVGIGTTSPTEKLEVSGHIKFGDASYNSTLNQAGIAKITSTFTDQSNVQFYGHTGGASNNLIMTLRGGGNVGIGTSSPASMLHAKASGYPTLTLEGGTNSGAGIRFFGDVQYAEIFGEYESATNGQMFFRTRKAGTISTAMTILSSGNVGIGTTSPSSKLHISQSSFNPLRIARDSVSDYSFELGGSGEFYIKNNLNSVYPISILNGGNVGIGTTSPSFQTHISKGTSTYLCVDNTSNDYRALFGATSSGTKIYSRVLSNNASAPMGFVIGETEVMTLDTGGAVIHNGVKTQSASGYSDISTTFYVDFRAFTSTPYKIVAALTHWIGAYGAYREMVEFNNAYTDLSYIDILNHSSTAGGSWSISRPDNATLRVTHNGGNYAAYGNWWIQVIGN